MSNYSPLGLPIVPGQGTPKFPQQIVPGFGEALGNARAGETTDPVRTQPAGLLVRTPEPSVTLSDAFDKSAVGERAKWDAIYNAIYNPSPTGTE
jgi:hypothetical protein